MSSNGYSNSNENRVRKVAMVLPTSIDRLFAEQVGPDCRMHLLKMEELPCSTKTKNMVPGFDLMPPGFDFVKYIDCCVDYMWKNQIRIVISMNDMAALMASAIAFEFKKRHGVKLYVPSVESAMLCTHKLLTREVLDPDPIRFWPLEVENMSAQEPEVLPCFIKPTAMLGSFGVFSVNNKLDLAEAEEYMRKNLRTFGGYLVPYFEKYANLPPEEVKRIDPGNVVLCEELIQATLNVFIDGTVDAGGNVSIWTVVDNNYHKRAKYCFSDHCVPSKLYHSRPGIVRAIKNKTIAIAENMVAKGFNSSWFSMEFFVTYDEEKNINSGSDDISDLKLKLIEINGRMSTTMLHIYPMMDLDMLGIQVDLSTGLLVSAPEESPIDTRNLDSGFGALVYFSIFVSDDDDGIKAENVLDFEAVEQIKKDETDIILTMRVFRGDRLYKSCYKSGTRLGWISLRGASREANMRRAVDLQKKMLRRPDMSPWHPKFKSQN